MPELRDAKTKGSAESVEKNGSLHVKLILFRVAFQQLCSGLSLHNLA